MHCLRVYAGLTNAGLLFLYGLCWRHQHVLLFLLGPQALLRVYVCPQTPCKVCVMFRVYVGLQTPFRVYARPTNTVLDLCRPQQHCFRVYVRFLLAPPTRSRVYVGPTNASKRVHVGPQTLLRIHVGPQTLFTVLVGPTYGWGLWGTPGEHV